VTNADVFINCPFDSEYRPAFEALIFTITASGYDARCALEDDDGANIRHDKLCRLIKESDKSIHDLSRVALGKNNLPRFNMPYELGLTHGAIKFGGRRQRTKTACIMVAEPFAMPAYISDLAGNDPHAHHNDPARIVRIVRNYLHTAPDGQMLPGAASLLARLERFKADLPRIASTFDIDKDEIDPYESYRSYLVFLTTFLTEAM
jgi:hypothetical protein